MLNTIYIENKEKLKEYINNTRNVLCFFVKPFRKLESSKETFYKVTIWKNIKE